MDWHWIAFAVAIIALCCLRGVRAAAIVVFLAIIRGFIYRRM